MNDELAHNEEVKESREDLQQLLESTYPLLKDFRDSCPGTYKHSVAVAAMVEGIALALGLDVNKLKVAALYHDVGKLLVNPQMFSENIQPKDKNLHNDLDPKVSYGIITRHVSDTVALLINNHDFPRDVIEIVSQHHGTNILKYFYNKAGSPDKENFRYKTTRPQSLEAAILMICDIVEAKAKSLMQAGKEFDNNSLVDDTITQLINDSQLDDVTIKLGNLKKIKVALAKELEGTYAKRIDYDELEGENTKVLEAKVKAEKD